MEFIVIAFPILFFGFLFFVGNAMMGEGEARKAAKKEIGVQIGITIKIIFWVIVAGSIIEALSS